MPKPGPRLRLVDVAERAGVSLATASRALAGRDGVSEEVASRVRQVSRELGYVANPYARTLAGGASSTVGLIVHQVDDPYFSEIAGGVIEIAGEQGLLVQICHSGRDPDDRAAADPPSHRPARGHPPHRRVGLRRRAHGGRGQGRAVRLPEPRRSGGGDRPALARRRRGPAGQRGGRASARRAPAGARPPPDRRGRRHARAHHGGRPPRRRGGRAGERGTLPGPASGRAHRLHPRGRPGRRRADPARPPRHDGHHRAQRRDGDGRAVDPARRAHPGAGADVRGRASTTSRSPPTSRRA